jgi:hypothetical protein
MADKKSDSKVIMSHMESRVSSMKQGSSKDMAKGPRKFAAKEVSNQVPRPPKR